MEVKSPNAPSSNGPVLAEDKAVKIFNDRPVGLRTKRDDDDLYCSESMELKDDFNATGKFRPRTNLLTDSLCRTNDSILQKHQKTATPQQQLTNVDTSIESK